MTDGGKIFYFPDIAAIEAEAAAWVARFDGGPLSAEELVQFQEWVNQSSAHRDAVMQYGGLWSEFDKLRTLTAAPEKARFEKPQLLSGMSRRWVAAAMAASLVGLAVYGIANWEGAVTPPETLLYKTAVGEQKTVTLADGSTVILNTNSRIDVVMSEEHRDVHLVRGEAYFDVAHEQQRPFTVYAGKGVVRDIGTAFNVRLLSHAVDVSVTTGSIEIYARTPQTGKAAEGVKNLGVIDAGRNVVFSGKIEQSQKISDADMKRKLAWRRGVLIYTGEPLERVAGDITRYSGIEVEIADPKLRNRPVGGSFKISQIDEVFVALKNNFGIYADWTDAKHVRLTSSLGPHPAGN